MEHTFPVLKPSVLCEFLEDLKFPMVMEDLKRPTQKGVRDVYLHFIELLTGVTWDQMQQPQLQAAETIGFPELHKDSIPQLTFTHTLSKLLASVGCPDFSQSDLNNPEPRRLICHLSALINFARFREDVLLKYEEYSHETEELLQKQDQLRKQNQEMAERIRAVREEREAENPQVADLQKEIEATSGELNKLNKQRNHLNSENDAVVKKMAQRNAELSDIKFKMFAVKQEIQELQGQCVSSPDKLKKNIKDLGHSVTAEKDKISEEGKRLHKLEAKSDALQVAEKQLAQVVRQQEEVEAEVNKYKATLDQIEATKLSRQEASERGRDAENQLQSVNRQVSSGQEKAVRQDKLHQAKMDKTNENLRVVEEETSDVMRERDANNAKDQLNAKIAKKIETKIQTVESEHEAAVAELTLQVEQVQESMAEYHNTMYSAMEIR